MSMKSFRLKAAAAFSILALGALAAGGVVAATQSSDEQALQPTREPADRRIESQVNRLLSRMTLEEKLQQIQLLPDFQVTDEGARNGLGSVLSLIDPAQDQTTSRRSPSRNRGWDPDPVRVRHDPRLPHDLPGPAGRRRELRPAGGGRRPHRTAPASRPPSGSSRSTPRWSMSRTSRAGAGSSRARARIRTSGSVLAAARVKAAQGSDYSAPDKVVTSVKHYAAYGQPEGGRDYNTTDMSEQRLRNLYLPPFKAAIDAGADTAMCSFNAINGVPGCANQYLRPTCSRRNGDSTASSRATTPPSPSCGPAHRSGPTPGRAGTASRRTGRTPPRTRSTPAPTPRW